MSNQRCPHCGNEVPAGAQHCPYCGSTINTFNPMTANGEPQFPGQPKQPFPGAYQQQPFPGPPKNNNNRPLLITLIAVLVVLVIAVIIGIVIFASKDSGDKEVDSVVTNTVVTDTVATTTPDTAAAPLPPVEKPAPKKYASNYDYVVTGSVGKYGIYMEISISGNSIYGRYKYNRVKSKGPQSWLTLSGTVSGNRFSMTESDYNGEFTGSFEGTYSLSGDRLSMHGNMYNQQGRTYNFNVSGNSSL